MRMFSVSQCVGVVFASLVGMVSSSAVALCPFNIDQSSTANSTRATTDGLLFLRYALGLPSTTPPVANATENSSLTSAQVATFIDANKTALDIDGDGKFTIFDAQVIARYITGFRGERLSAGLTTFDFGSRYGGAALQTYIDNGCTGLNDLPDPRVAVWNAMNTALVGGNTGLAKTYLTPNGLANHGPPIDSLTSQMPQIVASYSPLVASLVEDDYAEYIVARPVPGSTTGELQVFIVVFMRAPNGSWLIDAM
jgi:hypothetical protein